MMINAFASRVSPQTVGSHVYFLCKHTYGRYNIYVKQNKASYKVEVTFKSQQESTYKHAKSV